MTQQLTAARRRVARQVLGVLVILALAGIAASCAPAATVAPGASATGSTQTVSTTPGAAATPGTPAPAGVITLVAPAVGAVVIQNDPALATKCPASATRGLGYDIEFSWTVPADLATAKLQVVLQHGKAIPIPLDVDGAGATSLSVLDCNTYVIDTNLTGWHWQVNALGNGAQVLASSEQRALTFGPCRLANGTPCNAPA